MPTYPVDSGIIGRQNIYMFLRCKKRKKDGKEHRYWSVVENVRVGGNRVVQRQVLYLGELNDSQKSSWCRTIELFEHGKKRPHQAVLFPDDRTPSMLDKEVIQIQLNKLELQNPRQWGACWLACELWDLLDLDTFWQERLKPSREGTRWLNVLKTLVVYRLLDPGSEFRLHREWFNQNGMKDLLEEDFSLVAKDTLYRCLDKLEEHKTDLFQHLKKRWEDLFDTQYDLLLYDLTSTYFECDPPETGKRTFGYSRDKRQDCVQVVIALIVTPEGFPLAYEVLPGNTSDKTTLKEACDSIENKYGKARRIWLMDRGIPTEETLEDMRNRDVSYIVGTPKGRLTKLEKSLLNQPWEKVRSSVRVKLVSEESEVYVLVESCDRISKERSMRRRRLKKLWARLKELAVMNIKRDDLLMKLGAAKKEAGRVWSLVEVEVSGTLAKKADKRKRKQDKTTQADESCACNAESNKGTVPNNGDRPLCERRSNRNIVFSLNKQKLRQVRKREGRYLLRSNLCNHKPSNLWQHYLLLTEIEQAFKDMKQDLKIRPIYHQIDKRIDAHIFVSFLAYCIFITLKNISKRIAGGLTPRSIIEKIKHMQMVDVHLPTTDNRIVVLSRYTQPDADLNVLLHQLNMRLPSQPPPKIYAENIPIEK